MKQRYKIKYLKSRDRFVVHVLKKDLYSHTNRKVWRRLWGYEFATASQARKFAEGTI